jgi:hypothetical protein
MEEPHFLHVGGRVVVVGVDEGLTHLTGKELSKDGLARARDAHQDDDHAGVLPSATRHTGGLMTAPTAVSTSPT